MNTHPLLANLARFGVRLGLDRMRGFLEHLGAPHRAAPVIHVAGTNGKGSVVRLVGAILRAQGLRVGEYTSPHLQHINERLVVNGSAVSDAALTQLLASLDAERRAWVSAHLDGMCASEEALTYFEMMTAAAFVHFASEGVDVAVVEVGLGGRLDATNVVDPAVTVITSVGIDHTAQLGPDLASIAAEKAGIIKTERPVVVGALPREAMRVVRSLAADRAAPLLALEADFRMAEQDGTLSWSMGAHGYRDLTVALAGGHQLQNAAVAIAAVHQLPLELRPSGEAIRAGLAGVEHAGRLEQLAPGLILDCAHNGESAARLADWLREQPRTPDRRRTLLLGMSEDKDARSIVILLAPHFHRVLTTHCAHPRACSAGDLAEKIIGVDLPVLPAGPIEQALPLARSGGDEVVVAGSVFLAGAVRDLLGS